MARLATNPEISLLIPARAAGSEILSTIEAADAFLTSCALRAYEILIIPNGPESHSVQPHLFARFPSVRVIPHAGPAGKGAALRTGFEASQGDWIFFTDADLPYDLDFFSRALTLLRSQEADLVIGNRRRPDSVFDVPVELLPLAYRRHRLGILFNSLVRLLLPIATRDTQAGIKAFSRRLATAAFSRAECPGFFFDLELLLTAQAMGLPVRDLPVVLHLRSEKSTVRLLRDLLSAVQWIFRIRARFRKQAL